MGHMHARVGVYVHYAFLISAPLSGVCILLGVWQVSPGVPILTPDLIGGVPFVAGWTDSICSCADSCVYNVRITSDPSPTAPVIVLDAVPNGASAGTRIVR